VRVARICIIILPPSLEGLSGVFDTPQEKCPSGHGKPVTEAIHAFQSSSPLYPPRTYINIPKAAAPILTYGPPTPDASPQSTVMEMNVARSGNNHTDTGLATPPITPPNFSTTIHENTTTRLFLAKLFPTSVAEVARYAKGVSIESNLPDGSCSWWDGFILTAPHVPPAAPSQLNSKLRSKAVTPQSFPIRTLYMCARNPLKQHDSIRESIVALLDLAGEHLECDAVVMVLEREKGDNGRGSQEFGELLHSLMYVGFTVVTRPPFAIDPRYVLVGIEV